MNKTSKPDPTIPEQPVPQPAPVLPGDPIIEPDGPVILPAPPHDPLEPDPVNPRPPKLPDDNPDQV
jgi:hypothetical protein